MCLFQVRKGFWKPPPQIWLGDASKVRVLDPYFLHQTAVSLLKIPLHPKSKKVSDHIYLIAFHDSEGSQSVEVEISVQMHTKLPWFCSLVKQVKFFRRSLVFAL